MNCRLAFVFSYERFKNALICIISIGPSTELSPIFNFPTFRKNETSLELFNIVFENSFPKGFFWCNEKKSEFFHLALYSRYLQTTALKSWLFQNTIFQAHLLFWDHALFSFRFVNNIPAGMEPKKTEPLKLGLILGLISGHCKAIVLYSAIDLDVQTDRELERVKKWFQGRGWRVKIGERDAVGGGGEIRLHTAIVCLANARTLDTLGELCLVQFRMFRLPAANQGHMTGHIPWFIQILQNLILRGRTLSVLRVTHIAHRWEQKQAVIRLFSRRDLLASSFSFWFEWRKSWRVNLHVWSLFDLWKVTCTNGSVVQSLSDLTMIATDEECVNSSETACFMTWKKKHK